MTAPTTIASQALLKIGGTMQKIFNKIQQLAWRVIVGMDINQCQPTKHGVKDRVLDPWVDMVMSRTKLDYNVPQICWCFKD